LPPRHAQGKGGAPSGCAALDPQRKLRRDDQAWGGVVLVWVGGVAVSDGVVLAGGSAGAVGGVDGITGAASVDGAAGAAAGGAAPGFTVE
jgi:hypothetical protein